MTDENRTDLPVGAMTDTPMTDECTYIVPSRDTLNFVEGLTEVVPAEFARKLERQLHRSRKPILTDEEVRTIRSMSVYWHEVREREDRSPLTFELHQVVRMLGTKILWIVAEYAEHEAGRGAA